jgi:nucleoside-specific outer membrane channel protein Tsx
MNFNTSNSAQTIASSVRICTQAFVTAAGLLGSLAAYAGAAQWSSTNVQYLVSSKYQAIYFDEDAGQLDSVDATASIFTLEHVNGWKYGDNFFFVDVTNPDRSNSDLGPTGYYGEFSPRLSMSKIGGFDMSGGVIKDVLLTTSAELGDGFRNYLYGVAIDLNIPKVPVAQINYYIRNEIGPARDTGQQVTLVWLAPFSLGSTSWAFEGFFDYAFSMDHAEDNIVAGPRLMMDLGKTWGSADVFQIGIELQIWKNKFGLDGIDESAPQAMVKWIW